VTKEFNDEHVKKDINSMASWFDLAKHMKNK